MQAFQGTVGPGLQSGAIAGSYTLSTLKLPRYPLVPATLLGRLAISRDHQGQKLGRLLLLDALRRSWANTREVASIGVVVDAIDDKALSFYLHHEFSPFPDHLGKLFMAMRTIEQVLTCPG